MTAQGGSIRLTGTGLACVRGGREVFAAVSFAVGAGEALVLTGPNGAGKTTLLRALAGLLRFSAGEVAVTGAEPDPTLAEMAHYVGHQDSLKPALTVAENLAFWTAYLGSVTGQALADSLEAVGLASLIDTPAGYLSAGQRRRLSLARLLTAPRPIWLLDEPTNALDAAAQARLGGLLQAHLGSGGIVVAATHGPLPLARSITLALGEP